jgi:hypothetical protein
VIFLSGSVEITFPNSSAAHVFHGGKHNIIFAADTADRSAFGHISTVLGEDLESIMVPLVGGGVPEHVVLHDGVCGVGELAL